MHASRFFSWRHAGQLTLTVRFTAGRLQRVRLRQRRGRVATLAAGPTTAARVRERGKLGQVEQGRRSRVRRPVVEHAMEIVDAIPALRSVSS